MRNNLPNKIHIKECGIINLDSKENKGTHWTCYVKQKNVIFYYDSFGDLRAPLEVVDYFQTAKPCTIYFNHERYQNFNTVNCGHLCLKFLYNHIIN